MIEIIKLVILPYKYSHKVLDNIETITNINSKI